MAIENEKPLDTEVDDEVDETSEPTDDVNALKARITELETKQTKSREVRKMLKDKYETQIKELEAKVPKAEPEKKGEEKKSGELDWGQKAFLKSYGIAGAEELALTKSWLDRTGDDLDTLVSDDVFQARLSKLREAKASQDALKGTGGSKGAAPSAKDSVEYWMNKSFDEIPSLELKNKVIEARMKKEQSTTGGFHNS